MFKNVIILLWFFHRIESKNSTVQLKYSGNSSFLVVEVSVCDPEVPIKVPVNIIQEYTWLKSEKEIEDASKARKVKKNYPLKISRVNVMSTRCEDKVTLAVSVSIPLDIYYVWSRNLTVYDSGFGLAHKMDKKFSLVHQLKENGLIKNLSFGFYTYNFNSNKVKSYAGELYLGGFPPQITKKLYKTQCNALQDYTVWSCKLNQINIREKTFNNSNFVIFSSAEGKVYIPQDFLNFLLDLIGNICVLYEENPDKYFICYRDSFKKKKLNVKMSFIFDGAKLEIPFQNLFECDHLGYCQSLFVFSKKKDQTKWIIGYSLWMKYLTLFDYDNNAIVFYSDYPIEGTEKNFPSSNIIKERLRFILINCTNSILILSSIFLLLSNLKIK